MSLPKLYLETTIPSYLVARPGRNPGLAADLAITALWWKERRANFEKFVSLVVLEEIRQGEPAMAAARVAAVEGLHVLEATELAEELTERLLKEQIVPAVAARDAAHIGLAAAWRMNFLLTWNCKHINNRSVIHRIERACGLHGVPCPVIATPRELMNLEI